MAFGGMGDLMALSKMLHKEDVSAGARCRGRTLVRPLSQQLF